MNICKWVFNVLLFLILIPAIAIPSRAHAFFPIREEVDITPLHPLQSLAEDGWSYDGILDVLDWIELDDHSNDTEDDLENAHRLLISIARQGIMPGEDQEEEELLIEYDIAMLLQRDGRLFDFDIDFGSYMAPAIYTGGMEIITCKSWIDKKWEKTKKFVKKHRKAIIIGAAVAAAIIITAGIAAAASPAGAAAAGAAGAAGTAGAAASNSDKRDKDNQSSSEIQTEASASSNDIPIMKATIENKVTSFKESLAQGQFFQGSPQDKASLQENARIMGSLLAHEAYRTGQFAQIPEWAQKDPETLSRYHLDHQAIDRKFSTDTGFIYDDPKKDVDPVYYAHLLKGQNALAYGNATQAIEDFGKAIDRNPAYPDGYLDRGIANLSMGNLGQASQDYNNFIAQKQVYPFSVLEFSKGLALGIPKGIIDSGKGYISLVSDLTRHPIETASQICKGFAHLSELAKTKQWEALSQAVVPEAHTLIKEWDHIPSIERGKMASYVISKHGADIIFPGSAMKMLGAGVRGAKELCVAQKAFQNAGKVYLLEAATTTGSAGMAERVFLASQKTIANAEEVQLTTREVGRLGKAIHVEGAATKKTNFLKDPELIESFERHERAKAFLKPYGGHYFSEAEAREILHQAGFQTFPRFTGMPDNYLVRITDRGGGMEYVHPANAHIRVRVMPGKPHSEMPCQQKPYVIHQVEGRALDKAGNRVPLDAPEAHIPLDEFVYRDR